MYAVFMDYELDGVSNTVVLGGSIHQEKFCAMEWLESMRYGHELGYCSDEGEYIWTVNEIDLPWGYRYQTYYVSSYDPNQQMIGTH